MKKKFKQIVAIIMIIATLVTMAPITVFAAAPGKVDSGQVKIVNGNTYGVKVKPTWHRDGNSYAMTTQYNKEYASGTTEHPKGATYNASDRYNNIDQKYISNIPGNADGDYGAFEATPINDVPIFRLSRSYGETKGETKAGAVTTINIGDAYTFRNAAKGDGTTLTTLQAEMITKVLINGMKQLTVGGGNQYYQEQLYFFATQCIIWEISEGKRTDWGNQTGNYTWADTSTRNYEASASAISRSYPIWQSYNNNLKNCYFWHDFYYTVYYKDFVAKDKTQSYPDYYDQILRACENMGTRFQYKVENSSFTAFSKNENSAQAYEMPYNSNTGKYELSFDVSPEMIGTSMGLYNPNHIVVPVNKVNGQYPTVTVKNNYTVLRKTINEHSEVVTNSQGKEFGFSNSTMTIYGVTKDLDWYYVGIKEGGTNTWREGYVSKAHLDSSSGTTYSSKPTTNIAVSVKNNRITLSSTVPMTSDFTIRWTKNVACGYNEPNYFSGNGYTSQSSKNKSRGYLSGGNAVQETVFFKAHASAVNVNLRIIVDGKPIPELAQTAIIPKNSKFGDDTNSKRVYDTFTNNVNKKYPYLNGDIKYDIEKWTMQKGGSTSTSTSTDYPLYHRLDSNVTFTLELKIRTRTINFWCAEDKCLAESGSNVLIPAESQLIASITQPVGTYITIPNFKTTAHDHEYGSSEDLDCCFFDNWSYLAGEIIGGWFPSIYPKPADFKSGDKVLIDDLKTDYFACYSYANKFKVTYICGVCGETIGEFSGKAPEDNEYNADSYKVPQHTHTCKGEYYSDLTGESYPVNDLNLEFIGYTTTADESLADYVQSHGVDTSYTRNTTVNATVRFYRNETLIANYKPKNDVLVTAHGLDEQNANAWGSALDYTYYRYTGGKEDNSMSTATKYNQEITNDEEYLINRTFTNIFSGNVTAHITPPEGYHLDRIAVTDINGVYNETFVGDTTGEQLINAVHEACEYPAKIDVFFAKNDTWFDVNVHLVIAGQECDYREDTSRIVDSFNTQYQYATSANIKEDVLKDFFRDSIKEGTATFEYCGQYGVESLGNYKHTKENDGHVVNPEFKNLQDIKIFADTDVYIYYQPATLGGININIFSSIKDKDLEEAGNNGCTLSEVDTTMKVYTANTYIPITELYKEDGTFVDEVQLFKDITNEMISTDNTLEVDDTIYNKDDFPYVSSYKFLPEDLISGNYYYILIDDNIYDIIYYSPINAGGTAWEGFEQTYNFVCSKGDYRQVLRTYTEDEDGNKYPIQNAKVVIDKTGAASHDNNSTALGMVALVLAGMMVAGKITPEQFLSALMGYSIGDWVCPQCGYSNKKDINNPTPLNCQGCGYEFTSDSLSYVTTDNNGESIFYTSRKDYVFDIVNDDFTANSIIDNTTNYSMRKLNYYQYDDNKNEIQTAGPITNANTSGAIESFVTASANKEDSVVKGVADITECILFNPTAYIKFNIYSNYNLDGSSLKSTKDKKYLFTLNGRDAQKGEYNNIEYFNGTGDTTGNFKYYTSYIFIPDKYGNADYDFSVESPLNKLYFVNDKVTLDYQDKPLEYNLVVESSDAGEETSTNKFKPYIIFDDYLLKHANDGKELASVNDASFIKDYQAVLNIKDINGYTNVTFEIPDSLVDKMNTELSKHSDTDYVKVEETYDKYGIKYIVRIERNDGFKKFGHPRAFFDTEGTNDGLTSSLNQANFRVMFDVKTDINEAASLSCPLSFEDGNYNEIRSTYNGLNLTNIDSYSRLILKTDNNPNNNPKDIIITPPSLDEVPPFTDGEAIKPMRGFKLCHNAQGSQGVKVLLRYMDKDWYDDYNLAYNLSCAWDDDVMNALFSNPGFNQLKTIGFNYSNPNSKPEYLELDINSEELKNEGYKYYTIEYRPDSNFGVNTTFTDNGVSYKEFDKTAFRGTLSCGPFYDFHESGYSSTADYLINVLNTRYPDEEYSYGYEDVIYEYGEDYDNYFGNYRLPKQTGVMFDDLGSLDNEFHPIGNIDKAKLKVAEASGYGTCYIRVYTELPNTHEADFDVEFVQPNAGYKFDTTVVSTFMVNNHSDKQYTDKTPLNTTFNAYVNCLVDGVEKQMNIFTANKDLVLPANLNNILYYRWTVPSEENLKQAVAAKEGITADKVVITGFNVTAKVTDKEANYSKEDTGNVAADMLSKSLVPKSGYDLYGGKNFNYSDPTVDKEYHNVGSWQEYVCKDGVFTLLDNKARIDFDHNLLRPDELSSTQYAKDGQWFTRSGYSVRTEVTTSATVTSQSETIISSSMTPVQTAEVYYPEFNYTKVDSQYEAMVLDKTNNMFIFKDVENADTIRPRHYIPIWFPDRDYITQVRLSDAWTPAGMLTYLGESNPVGINGSLFDDYHSQQRVW